MNHCNPLITRCAARFGRVISSALVIAAVAAPAAHAVDHAASQDLRSPDARDAARATAVFQDLRSSDTRDVSRPRFTPSQMPDAESPASRPAAPSVSESNGFPWLEASVAMGLIGLGVVTLRRRRSVARA